ncbi:hypothetical protein [Acetobacterium carbinolicum]|uniref:glycan biosynthesis hexose transferase WsfD n=1 Tax=Acetobacterium carbinolicum TaxID=52690 RepID=UPI0039C8C762
METQSKTKKGIKLLIDIFQRFKNLINSINQRMEGKYTPSLIALVVTGFVTIISVIILFIPNYLGVADDGSVTKIINAAGIYYLQEEPEQIYNNYFIRTYSNVPSTTNQINDDSSSHILVVKAAVFLDNIVTRDKSFDSRFLALIYLIFYIPAIYLLIKQACRRAKNFSEGIVIGVVGGLIFSDVAYITYFNSFYPEAIWLICLVYCVGFGLSFQEKRDIYNDIGHLFCFLIASTVLITSKNQCAIIGIIFGVYCIKLMFLRERWLWKSICVTAAIFLCLMTLVSMLSLKNDFDETSKLHAMTRGVLFTSDNPAETLAEFDIASSYEMLTDASTYDFLPFVRASEPSLKTGFLDQYTISDITAYYVRHPGQLIRMTDISIKSCFELRRSYCGNYEMSVGMPEKAKSIFWSTWSTLKSTSMPKTIGFLIVLIVGLLMLFGKNYSLRPVEDNRDTVFLDTLLVVVLLLLSQSFITIVNSGDAEMIQHCFLVSLGMDIITYFVFAEIVNKLNIL